jgi:DHA1 family bicyclomycin/chloramphenicol resistance-like MFS transporter
MFTYIASSAVVIIGLYHVPPTRFGLVFGANAVGLIAVSQLNRYLLRFYSADGLLRGAALASVAFAVLLALSAVTGWGGLWGILPPLFLTVSVTSMIQANSLAGALSTDPLRAGSIAALVGSASFAVSAIAASIAGAAYDGTARPMAFVILACLGGCAAATFGVVRTSRR